MIIYEKIRRLEGYCNSQNDGVRESSAANNLHPQQKSKFSALIMIWLEMTANGTAKLHIFNNKKKKTMSKRIKIATGVNVQFALCQNLADKC